MYVKWFDTVNVSFCHFQISRRSVPPYVPTLAGYGTQMTDAGIRQITLSGTPRE
ncbi:unnamed protein product, partial [Staurois parvus]